MAWPLTNADLTPNVAIAGLPGPGVDALEPVALLPADASSIVAAFSPRFMFVTPPPKSLKMGFGVEAAWTQLGTVANASTRPDSRVAVAFQQLSLLQATNTVLAPSTDIIGWASTWATSLGLPRMDIRPILNPLINLAAQVNRPFDPGADGMDWYNTGLRWNYFRRMSTIVHEMRHWERPHRYTQHMGTSAPGTTAGRDLRWVYQPDDAAWAAVWDGFDPRFLGEPISMTMNPTNLTLAERQNMRTDIPLQDEGFVYPRVPGAYQFGIQYQIDLLVSGLVASPALLNQIIAAANFDLGNRLILPPGWTLATIQAAAGTLLAPAWMEWGNF